MIKIALDLIISIIKMILTFRVVGIFFNKISNKYYISLLIIFLSVLNTILNSFNTINENIINLMITISSALIIAFLLYKKANVIKKLFLLIIYFLFGIILDAMISFIIINKWSYSTAFQNQNDFLLYIAQFLFYTIIYIIIQFLKRKYNNKYTLQGQNNIYFIQSVIPILSLVFIVIFINFQIYNNYLYLSLNYFLIIIFACINTVCYIIFNFIEKLYMQNKESELINLKLKMRENHYLEIEKQIEDIRKFKHNIRNQISVINTYIKNGIYNDAIILLNSLFKDIDTATNYNFSQNRTINTLINIKYYKMRRNLIRFNCHIMVPSIIGIKEIDLIAIIGNILDNAIEASIKCSLNNRNITIKIIYYNGNLVIYSKNSIENAVVNFETQKQNQREHGLGMKSVFNTVKQYDGVCNWNSTNKEFEINIILCDNYILADNI